MNKEHVDIKQTYQVDLEPFEFDSVPYTELIDTFLDLTEICKSHGQFENAIILNKSALELMEESMGENVIELLPVMESLINLYGVQCQYTAAATLYVKMFSIATQSLGSKHPIIAEILEKYAVLLKAANREIESAIMQTRAKTIRMHDPKLIPIPSHDTGILDAYEEQLKAAAS
jgi:hypothetical protein